MRELSAELLSGLLGVDGAQGILLDDAVHIEGEDAWILPLTLTIPHGSENVASITEWFVRVQYGYPSGAIDVLPSAANSIETTFPHQNANRFVAGRPWRNGRLCVDQSGRHLFGERALSQPRSPRERLAWHLRSAREWIIAAAEGTLRLPGDPFELPDVPIRDGCVLAYAEDDATFGSWLDEFSKPPGLSSTCSVVEVMPGLLVVRTSRRKASVIPLWGKLVMAAEDFASAWILLPAVPTVGVYAFPSTWGELRSACAAFGVNLNEKLKQIAPDLRECASGALLIICFPIPDTVGGPDVEVALQALRLPRLTRSPQMNERQRWRLDISQLFRNNHPIDWLRTTNVADAHFATRGRLPDTLRDAYVVLIGCGSLGSMIAELLIRKGLRRLTLLDGDSFAIANTRRHVLTLEEIGQSKATALAARLNTISLFANVEAISTALCWPIDPNNAVTACDVVIDCTAEDDIIQDLSALPEGKKKRFYSFAMRSYATSLLAFASEGTSIDADAFFQAVTRLEHDLVKDDSAIRDAGCQNPAFPAHWDRIVALASRAVHFVETKINMELPTPVFETIDA